MTLVRAQNNVIRAKYWILYLLHILCIQIQKRLFPSFNEATVSVCVCTS